MHIHPLRMPLHRQQKRPPRRLRPFDPLDRAIFRPTVDPQSLTQEPDGLMMGTVHYSTPCSHDLLQETIPFQHYPMPLILRLILMHRIPRLSKILDQRPAIHYVDQLQPPADTQDRQFLLPGRL